MSYKTLKRRLQRRKQVHVKKKRILWLQSIRDGAFNEWKEKNLPNIRKALLEV